jgi:transcriptional regulator with XRE-family HTH domain
MRLNPENLRRLARERGLSLSAVLRRAGVSRTAYYSLARRESVLPNSIHALAKELGVSPVELLDAEPWPHEYRARSLLEEARTICAEHPEASFENVWHTLNLLDLPPEERLNRSLIRGRATSVHR